MKNILSAFRTIIAVSLALILIACRGDDHDITVITTTQETVFPTSSTSEFDRTSLELITGTVWQNGEHLLFYLRSGKNYRSYLVDPEGLVRLPEWSMLVSGSDEKTKSLHEYDEFAPNLPQSLIATSGGVLRQIQAGDLYILDFISLVDGGKGLRIYDEPSSDILSYYIDNLPEDRIIESTSDKFFGRLEKVFLFDTLPQSIALALLEKPEIIYTIPKTDSAEDVNWKKTDLMVPFDLNDTSSIGKLAEAAQTAPADAAEAAADAAVNGVL